MSFSAALIENLYAVDLFAITTSDARCCLSESDCTALIYAHSLWLLSSESCHCTGNAPLSSRLYHMRKSTDESTPLSLTPIADCIQFRTWELAFRTATESSPSYSSVFPSVLYGQWAWWYHNVTFQWLHSLCSSELEWAANLRPNFWDPLKPSKNSWRLFPKLRKKNFKEGSF